MEKMNIHEVVIERDFLEWFIVHSLTKHNAVDEIVKSGAKEFEIQLLINGIEVPFVSTLKDIEEQLDRMVKEEAMKLLKEKISPFDELQETLNAAARKIKAELDLQDEDIW